MEKNCIALMDFYASLSIIRKVTMFKKPLADVNFKLNVPISKTK